MEITVEQAAEILNVSVIFMIGLLKEDKIFHQEIDGVYYVSLDDLLKYRRKVKEEALAAFKEMTESDQELGLY